MVEVNTIGIIGAGIMGASIAQVSAEAGYQVIVRDIAEQYVEKGLNAIRKVYERNIQKGKMSVEEAEQILGRIKWTVNVNDLAGVDLVVEAVIERMDLKQQVFQELDRVCQPEAILATNTSGLSITEIAAATNRPKKVIGVHFFNPVPVLKLVELTRGAETSEETFQIARGFAEKVGKEPIEVLEAPGFVVNRILVPMINEAAFVLMEGISSAAEIDKGMRLGCNHPIGPLALGDLIGLDTCLFIMDTLFNETKDPKYRACPLLRKKVRAGQLGRKTGQGFFPY